MSMHLVVQAQYLHSQYHGRSADERAQWPPHPCRVFQALLSGASVGGRIRDGAADAAMRWLERLPPPIVACSQGGVKPPEWITYAPNNNDWDAKTDPAAMKRDHAETHAPTSFEHPPALFCAWPIPDGDDDARTHLVSLSGAADMVNRIGTAMDSAWANVRVMSKADFLDEAHRCGMRVLRPDDRGASAGGIRMGVPYQGCMDELAQIRNTPVAAPRRWPLTVRYDAPWEWRVYAMLRADERPFAVDWADGAMLALRVKERLTDVFGRAGAHLARVMPLPSVGHQHADLRIRRFAILRMDGGMAWDDADAALSGRPIPGLGLVAGGCRRDLEFMNQHYAGTSTEWTSATPVRLSRVRRPARPDASADKMRSAFQAASDGVCEMLRQAGVDAPVESVTVSDRGFPPHDMEAFGNRRTELLKAARERRCLWHVRLSLERPVAGPLVVGHNPSLGLGVMAKVIGHA